MMGRSKRTGEEQRTAVAVTETRSNGVRSTIDYPAHDPRRIFSSYPLRTSDATLTLTGKQLPTVARKWTRIISFCDKGGTILRDEVIRKVLRLRVMGTPDAPRQRHLDRGLDGLLKIALQIGNHLS